MCWLCPVPPCVSDARTDISSGIISYSIVGPHGFHPTLSYLDLCSVLTCPLVPGQTFMHTVTVAPDAGAVAGNYTVHVEAYSYMSPFRRLINKQQQQHQHHNSLFGSGVFNFLNRTAMKHMRRLHAPRPKPPPPPHRTYLACYETTAEVYNC